MRPKLDPASAVDLAVQKCTPPGESIERRTRGMCPTKARLDGAFGAEHLVDANRVEMRLNTGLLVENGARKQTLRFAVCEPWSVCDPSVSFLPNKQ